MSGSKPLTIALVEPVGGHSGMDYYDLGLGAGLASNGVQVLLYTCDETTQESGAEIRIYKFYERIFGKDRVWKRALHYLQGSIKSLFHARYSGAKIGHFHLFYAGPLEFFNIVLARLIGLRVVITAHDVESFVTTLSKPFLLRSTYKLANAVIAHNWVSQRELVERLGIPPGKIAVIPHGNYLHFIRSIPGKAEARRQLGLPAETNVLLFFGQIKEVKGLDLLIKALPSVLERCPNTMLVIAGRVWKDDFSTYEHLIDEYGLQRNCLTNVRHIADGEVPNFFVSSDLVILPYKRIYQSGVLLMAMSYARPVLVSDLAGMLEVIEDGKTGFVFEQGKICSLSQKILELLANPVKMEEVSHAGRRLMEAKYGWGQIGQLTKSCYQSLLYPIDSRQ